MSVSFRLNLKIEFLTEASLEIIIFNCLVTVAYIYVWLINDNNKTVQKLSFQVDDFKSLIISFLIVGNEFYSIMNLYQALVNLYLVALL